MGRPRKNAEAETNDPEAIGFEIGEQKDLVIVSVGRNDDDSFNVIAKGENESSGAIFSVVNKSPAYTPAEGDTWKFQRYAHGMEMVAINVAPKGDEGSTKVIPTTEAEAPAAEDKPAEEDHQNAEEKAEEGEEA